MPTSPSPEAHAAAVVALGRTAGLDRVGIAAATPFRDVHDVLESRKAAGLHDGMQFTYRNPARSTDPERILPGARSLVVGARSYRAGAPARPAGPTGRVARYAWHDHYRSLRGALSVVADRLREDGHRAVVVADDNALVDRAAAHRAGIGWFGKNTNLLLPGQGSWFVLGAVVTTAVLTPAEAPVTDGCGTCRRCLDGCPTGAIVAPGVVDAARCLAWLVQKPGVFPREHREALHDRLYGCDDCQEVCPPNQRLDRREPAAHASHGAAAWVPLTALLDADDETLLARHGRWYVPERDARWLRRNALVALGNVATAEDPEVDRVLDRYLRHPDPVLRAHAVWAAARAGRSRLLATVAGDRDPLVRAELVAVGADA